MKEAALYYLGAGLAWWAVEQLVYVNGGRPYWLGLSTLDTGNPFTNTLLSAETIALWPVSIYWTLTNQIVP